MGEYRDWKSPQPACPLIPTINNDFDGPRVATMLSSVVSRTAHVTALVNLVTLNGYDGIDYESLAATDWDRFTAFISEPSVVLHALGKTLTGAVHRKTSEPGNWCCVIDRPICCRSLLRCRLQTA